MDEAQRVAEARENVADINEELEPLKAGICRDSEETSRVWAVYDKAAAEAVVGWVADSGNTEFAERLTGWVPAWRGAGRTFSDEADMRVYGKKILVVQRRGLDI
jgi:hypothetical protein